MYRPPPPQLYTSLNFRNPILCLPINYVFHIALSVLYDFCFLCFLIWHMVDEELSMLSLLSALTDGGWRALNAISTLYFICLCVMFSILASCFLPGYLVLIEDMYELTWTDAAVCAADYVVSWGINFFFVLVHIFIIFSLLAFAADVDRGSMLTWNWHVYNAGKSGRRLHHLAAAGTGLWPQVAIWWQQCMC
jgi:hypothetical protein